MNFLLPALCLSMIAPAYAADNRTADLEEFIKGNFVLVGISLGSKRTYLGEVAITKNAAGLQVTRVISGRKIIASAAIEHATADMVPVLRIRFAEKGKQYEETCLVGGDLDNYARITCHLYVPGAETEEPGMEAMFINTNAPQ